MTDCKLYFYTKNNKLATGYNLGAFKLPDGATLIGSGIGLGGMDNAKAVKKFYATYPTNGILDAYIYNETGNDTSPKMVKLKSNIFRTGVWEGVYNSEFEKRDKCRCM